jgi:chemotaxis protein CheY-P-specific phosphatase CheC
MEIKPIINDTLEALGSKIESELGGLLDCQLALSPPRTSLVSKEQFFAQTGKKLVMTRMSVSGDREGELYVFCQLKDAVTLGGILIMLPPAELEKRVKKEEFSDEEADAFGEIANILSGDLNSAFEDIHPDKLHFKKTGLEIVIPGKVKPLDAEPFPPGTFVLASYGMNLDGKPLNELQLLFPAGLLGIEIPATIEKPVEETFVPVTELPSEAPADAKTVIRPATAGESARTEVPAREAIEPAEAGEAKPVVLVVAAETESAGLLIEVLRENGWQAKLLGGKENFKDVLQDCGGDIRGIILVMGEIEDQSLAAAIKLRSAFGKTVPLVAAGSHWTRSTVLQAVKYGIRDILVLPASAEEILEKASAHFSSNHP